MRLLASGAVDAVVSEGNGSTIVACRCQALRGAGAWIAAPRTGGSPARARRIAAADRRWWPCVRGDRSFGSSRSAGSCLPEGDQESPTAAHRVAQQWTGACCGFTGGCSKPAIVFPIIGAEPQSSGCGRGFSAGSKKDSGCGPRLFTGTYHLQRNSSSGAFGPGENHCASGRSARKPSKPAGTSTVFRPLVIGPLEKQLGGSKQHTSAPAAEPGLSPALPMKSNLQLFPAFEAISRRNGG
jgi:hypothetical protein